MQDGEAFSRLIDEHGSDHKAVQQGAPSCNDVVQAPDTKSLEEEEATKGREQLMSEEERNRGAVPFYVYKRYLKNAGLMWGPIVFVLLALMEGASSTYIHSSQGTSV